MKRLPEDLSTFTPDDLHRAATARDARITRLFRRWPGLSATEAGDLARLYAERVRVARELGRQRRRRRQRLLAS